MLAIPGYRLLELFQTTSSNLLFRAVREADQLPIIVKTPATEHPGPRERSRYQRELNLLQRLKSTPGVITVHGHEVLKERPFLFLEDVGGKALEDQLGQPFEPSRFLSMAVPLATILAEVHGRGVIHKDIKPSNILLSKEGRVWLIDFGVATLQQAEHVEALPISFAEGTLAYMSPEQSGRMNRAVDYRTDFYSLGVTLYQMLTGQLPFRGKDPLEWVHAHIAQAPVPPERLVPSIPPMLSGVVLKLLAKAAEDRYQSAEGLRADLERCREGLRRGVMESFPLGFQDFPARFQLPQHLYGREAEVESLLGAFERVAGEGRPECVLVRGYSGIGKSSVVQELHKPVLERRGFFLSGKFSQLQRDMPYATLAWSMRTLVQQVLAGSDEEVEAWRKRLLEAFEGNGQVLVELVPQLEQVVGRQPQVPELPPAETQNRFNRLFQRFLGVFASSERSLVLFLDDLQWADFASLKLLQYLTTHADTPAFLLIGAYRDNEVGASHPLALVLEGVRKAGARLSDIHLGPLSTAQIQEMVADALPGAAWGVVRPLAELLQEKTGGNPFFLLQLLQTLYQDGLVARVPQEGWRWDAEAVRAKGYSDNVVDFMAGRLRQLPAGAQPLVHRAACVGSTFALETLALISRQEVSEVERGLEPALQEGLIVQSGSQHYRFLHDRIQQAAYTLIPEEERKAIHLEIGRLLWSRLSPEELHERLFDVVGQLNAGADLIDDTEERFRLARLNAEAGFRAKASTAHRSAVGYLTMAFSLLPGDGWETAPELAFKLRLAQAGSELMSGNAPEARRIVDEILPRARTRQDLAAGYQLKSSILVTTNQPEVAATCLLECLERFGVSMPAKPTWEEVVAANAEVETLLGERPIESLIDLPPMTDRDMKTVMGVLAALFAPAFFTNEKLLALHLCRMVALSLRHGNTPEAASGYVWYGFVTSCLFRKYHRGYAFGRLAWDFVERNDLSAYRGRILYTLGHISLWVRPLSGAKELYEGAFQHSVLAGDLQIASYCCIFVAWTCLSTGADLAEVFREAAARAEFSRKAGFRDAAEIARLVQRFVQQMRGLTPSFDSLSMEGFDEKEFESQLKIAMAPLKCSYAVIRTRSRFMCGDYEEARQAGDEAAKWLWAVVGRPQLFDHHLYRALSLAACYPKASAQQQQEYLATIQQHQKQLEEWAANCPANSRAAERMVSAELDRLGGRWMAAMHGYEEAIQAAREHGLVHNVAVASELAARFYLEHGPASVAVFHARQAREAYAQWGAEGKVRQMDEQWPQLTALLAGNKSSTFDTGPTHLDALSLVKAQQAISGEINLQSLVATLMRVALESAGAQRGALLVPQGDALKVEAVVDSTQGAVDAVSQELPWTVFSYVRRTREHVLIDDTSQPHPFSSDAFFASSRAQTVLCLPLRRKDELQGLLFLENALTTGAFSAKRITLLQHLASQAAISMEVARLYAEVQKAEAALRRSNEELELRVEARTRELRQAQARLVETARMAGMAEVAANVLHDVGNVLNSLVVDTDAIRDAVAASRVARVEQVVNLLEEHRPHLSEFLTEDARGRHLIAFLSGLAGELKQEWGTLNEGVANVARNVDRVRAIVQMQRTYAASTLLVEECDLAEVLEEALRLQLGALQQAGVKVTKELRSASRVKTDRHRLLQIVINLLSNARQALEAVAPGQRLLWLRMHGDAEWVHIQVVDNGDGIPLEGRKRLFTQGYTTRKEGHGIGLHSSAIAAQLMGGQLTLESEGPGRGAVATLKLPTAGPAPSSLVAST